MRHLVEQENLASHIHIDSAGTASYHIGSLADERTRSVASERGIELLHRARAFDTEDFYRFDYIIPMDESNMSNVLRHMPEDNKARLHLMREFDSVGAGEAVPDPYYGDRSDFEKVHDILERSCTHFLAYLKQKYLNVSE